MRSPSNLSSPVQNSSLAIAALVLAVVAVAAYVSAASVTKKEELTGTFVFPKTSYAIGEVIEGTFTLINPGPAFIARVSYPTLTKKQQKQLASTTVKLVKDARITIKTKADKAGKLPITVTVTKPGQKFKKVFSHTLVILAKGALSKKTPEEKTAEQARLRTQRTGGLPSPAATGPTGTCVSPPSGLVAWFPADGNAREVVHGRHGAIATSIGFAEGKIGQAFSYPNASPGSDDVRVIDPGNYELDLSGSFTVEAWIKFLEEPEGGRQALIFAKGSPGSLWVGDLLSGRVEATGGWPVQITRYSDDSALLRNEQPANVWTHVALTFDGRFLNAYRNGDRESGGDAGPGFTLGQNDSHFLIGDDERSHVPYLLDEIRVYNRELSEDELERIYNDGSAPRCVPVDPAPTACILPPLGQVAWFTGDDTLVDSVSRLEGTFSSYGTYGAGLVGNAFTKTAGPRPTSGLDESIFRINDPGTADFPLDLASFTVEGWVKFSEVEGILRAGNILHKGGNYKLDGNGPSARVDGLSLVASANSPTIAANQWAHVASTYDGRRLNLYVNGALVGLRDVTGTTPRPAPVNNERLSVGYYSLGTIDELSFYNRALDRQEIDQIYRAGSFGKCPPAG